jgi:FKBP-type peptidyl-prolyl cis-trans isomerase
MWRRGQGRQAALRPTVEDVVLIKYKGTLPDGKVFDEQASSAAPGDRR